MANVADMRNSMQIKNEDDIHVIPVGDTKEHALSAKCWCIPTVEVYGSLLLIIHNAKDNRDMSEYKNDNTIAEWLYDARGE